MKTWEGENGRRVAPSHAASPSLRRPKAPATETRMRVLITRPEREATTLATALSQRGHVPVIAPLFRLEILHPPADFAASLAACQAVLLTSANGARALAEASEQRARPILAVGDTTATTAEGLGFTAVASAAGDGAALVELVRKRLDPKDGPLVHVCGADQALDLGAALSHDGFEVRRFVLYDARAEGALPDSARAALQVRALDAATFFSPRAAAGFAALLSKAGLVDSVRDITAIAISPAALAGGDRRAGRSRRKRTSHHERHAFFSAAAEAADAAAHPGAPRPRCIRRLCHRPGHRGDRAGGRRDLAAVLAGTGAGAVARPGGHSARADTGARPAIRPGSRQRGRQCRGRDGQARPHGPP